MARIVASGLPGAGDADYYVRLELADGSVLAGIANPANPTKTVHVESFTDEQLNDYSVGTGTAVNVTTKRVVTARINLDKSKGNRLIRTGQFANARYLLCPCVFEVDENGNAVRCLYCLCMVF